MVPTCNQGISISPCAILQIGGHSPADQQEQLCQTRNTNDEQQILLKSTQKLVRHAGAGPQPILDLISFFEFLHNIYYISMQVYQ